MNLMNEFDEFQALKHIQRNEQRNLFIENCFDSALIKSTVIF